MNESELYSAIPVRHEGCLRIARRMRSGLSVCALAAMLASGYALGQAITIDTHGNATNPVTGTVDRRFAQVKPTNVELGKEPLDTKTRLELYRLLQAEQGFAMRPIPRGHKGLTLQANGKLEPAGEPYLEMVTTNGLCAKPGDRLVITDLKIEHEKIELILNGGPDLKHRFMRHIQIGAGPNMNPIIQDNEADPTGARVTLTFKGPVPVMTDKQVKALLAPLISFDEKTPIQAFTDTLPTKLKEAILNHQVMVGMTTDMVMFAMGTPGQKIRFMDGQMPIEQWIYGKPPEPVHFVNINGNRVVKLEIAEIGKPLKIFEKDEVEGLMRTDGTPLSPDTSTRTIAMGDTQRNPDTQAPAPAPTLGAPDPGSAPATTQGREGQMKPVEFPKQKPDDYPDATNLPRTPAADQTDAKAGEPKAPADGTKAPDTKNTPDTKTPPAPPSQPAQNPPSSQD